VRQYGSNAYSTGAGSIYEVTIGGSGTGEYLYVPSASEMNTRVLTVRLVHSTHKVYPFCAQIWTEDGYVSGIKARTDKLTFDDVNNVYANTAVLDSNAVVPIWTYSNRTLTGNVTVGGYASGQNPANYVLANPSNKLATDASGRVTVGSNADKTNYQVGSYASGQSPAEQVLATPANKLATDASGRVTVGSNADKTGYTLTSGEHTQIQSDVQSGMTAQGYTSARAPKLDNLDATVGSRAAPGDAMTLTSGERSNIASAVWSATSRTLTSFGTLVSDVASAVWSYASRTLTALGNALVDEVWNRLRSATSRPVGSFGYYLDAQVSAGGGGGGGGGSGFIGPRTITFQVRDAANQPVPGALIIVHGVGAALTNASGELVVDMPEGAFTVSVIGKDGLLFDSQTTPATGDAGLQFIGYTRVPPTASDPGTCVVYVDVTASCNGTLTIVELPRKLSGGKWLVGQTQQKSSSAGRITFDAVPWGATVRVVVPAAKVDTTFVVPEASSYAV
jgi:hypothetical protein